MDYEEAKSRIIGLEPDFLTKARKPVNGRKSYVCPVCGNGSGDDGDGIAYDPTSKPGHPHYTCFKCGLHEDNLGLWRIHKNISNGKDALISLYDYYGITGADAGKRESYQNQPKTEQYTHDSIHTTDYTEFFLQANKDLEKTTYHRGISLETLNRFRIGYVESWRHPKAPSAPASPRLIIPTSRESYLARDTRAEIPEGEKKYSKSKVGSIHLFNTRALDAATKPIFIVEGELDALSIIDVGGEAMALGTTSKIRGFLELLKNKKPAQPLIIALDNDEAGNSASDTLAAGLTGLGISFYRINPAGEYKDANEALNADREAFAQRVEEAELVQKEAEQAEKERYLHTSAAYHIQSFIDGIADSVNTPAIPTGFKKLDAALDDGLYQGLYTIGAISSLGKTTLVTQMADQIAQAGYDVLIFSLEMAREELMAKSISRHTLEIVLEDGGDIRNAKTARGITTGKRYEKYSQFERDLINGAVIEYSKYADHIYINEGVGDIGAEQIRETVRQHISITGNSPVVIVDYLQILAPYNERATDKQNTDKAVLEMRRIGRDFKIPVVCISSFNRQNYKEAVAMDAFKESGAIEYSSDVLIGLQLKGAGQKEFNEKEAKRKDPREIELVILKSRSGRTGDTISYRYYPMFNYFEES